MEATKRPLLLLLALLLCSHLCAALQGAENTSQQRSNHRHRHRGHHGETKARSYSLSRDAVARDNIGWLGDRAFIPGHEAIRYSATAKNQRARLANAAAASAAASAVASADAATGARADNTGVTMSNFPQVAVKGAGPGAAEGGEAEAEADLSAQDTERLGRLLRYWGGRMMAEPDALNVYVVWYGDWSHAQMSIVRRFMASLEAYDGGGYTSRGSSNSGSSDSGSGEGSSSSGSDSSSSSMGAVESPTGSGNSGNGGNSGDGGNGGNSTSSGNGRASERQEVDIGQGSSSTRSNASSGHRDSGVGGNRHRGRGGAANNAADTKSLEPTVAGWWDITVRYYSDVAGRRAASRLRLAGEIVDSYSLSPLGSILSPLSHEDVRQILRRALDASHKEHLPLDPSAAYVILTSGDVHVTDFCKGFCAYHTSATIVDGGPKLAYAFVGDSTKQCPFNCTYRYYDEGFVGSNGDLAADSVVDKLAHELTELVTNPFQGGDSTAGWVVGGEGTGEAKFQQIENADLCEWRYSAVQRDGNGRQWNLVGVNGTKYLIQDNFNVEQRQCVLQGGVR
ncbi:hypothetical protein CLOM_g14943 [Closterium sp. NIES-68]|nr:hypothetical protein CLOM_g14943 [Closterium sp. NIES-68]GJP70085.1 hypothetical protein CLOP_g1070 [Closterium sp. NIES-67]